jgi:hypothetical protein
MNYVQYVRSSYVPVKDEKAFRELCADMGCEAYTGQAQDGATLFGFGTDTGEGINEQDQDDNPTNWVERLSALIADGWAIEVRSISYEGMRYLGGHTFILKAGEAISAWADLDEWAAEQRKRLEAEGVIINEPYN